MDSARAPFLIAAAGAAATLATAFAGALAVPVALGFCGALLGVAVLISRNMARPQSVRAGAGRSDDALPGFARGVIEHLADPIVVLDEGGRVVMANGASRSLVGPNAERKHISAVLRNPEVLGAVDRVLAGSEPRTVEFSFLVPVERHYRAYVARTGAERTLVLIQFNDLTAVRRAEQMRVDFVANASHELRTPLAAVSGFIDTLRGHAKEDAEARERFLGIMSVEAGRMRRLIDDLLSLSRIELNEHNAPSGRTDLTAAVRDAAAALAPLAKADNINLDVGGADTLPVIGDHDELIQVFQNLIHNAIKYGRPGGSVSITLGRARGQGRGVSGGFVFAAVKDDGEGIAREVIPRLTERFYRVDVKRSRERGGTGLGLAIVKHILNRHRGRLQIESEPGQGSVFTVYLPAAGAPDETLGSAEP